MNNEETTPGSPKPAIAEVESPDSNDAASNRVNQETDQEMADAYGFTPQQAKAMGMYL